MNKPILTKTPVTAESIAQDWTAMVREIILREGQPVRMISKTLTIEIKSLHDNIWRPLMLPEGGFVFVSDEERKLIYERIVNGPHAH